MRRLLQHYSVAFLTLLLAASLAYWPTILNPLAQAYIRLCGHSLQHLPLYLHHYPPYVVAILLVGLGEEGTAGYQELPADLTTELV
jgi:hypothetical protein